MPASLLDSLANEPLKIDGRRRNRSPVPVTVTEPARGGNVGLISFAAVLSWNQVLAGAPH